jgi:hypothetical protein
MLNSPFEILALTDISVDSSLTTPIQSITFIHSVHDASWVRPRITKQGFSHTIPQTRSDGHFTYKPFGWRFLVPHASARGSERGRLLSGVSARLQAARECAVGAEAGGLLLV